MNRGFFRILTALVVLTSGCGSGNPGTSPVRSSTGISPSRTSAWSAKYLGSCRELAADRCVGAYGFTVTSDGAFEAGPGPSGQTFDGRVTAEEVRAIGTAVSKDLAAKPVSAADCGGDAKVMLTGSGGAYLSCDPELVSSLARLAAIYYPAQFPNPCIDAATALKERYDAVSVCVSNSDCAYLESDFLPWSRDSGETEVIVDDCSYVPALPAGNVFECTASQLELLLKRDLAKKVCEGVAPRAACTDARGFSPESAPPVCERGRCRANPLVDIK